MRSFFEGKARENVSTHDDYTTLQLYFTTVHSPQRHPTTPTTPLPYPTLPTLPPSHATPHPTLPIVQPTIQLFI